MDSYKIKELQRILDAGPADGEDFFRLRISGAKKTKHLNISKNELQTLIYAIDVASLNRRF